MPLIPKLPPLVPEGPKHEDERRWKYGGARQIRKICTTLWTWSLALLSAECITEAVVNNLTAPEEGAGTLLSDCPAPQRPLLWCRQRWRQGFLKSWMRLYLPKVPAQGWFCQPGPQMAVGDRGCPSSDQSWWPLGQCSLLGLPPGGTNMGSRCRHRHLRKALSASGSPGKTAGHGRPGAPGRSPGAGPGR